jgi:hypothetical protein
MFIPHHFFTFFFRTKGASEKVVGDELRLIAL